jgi:uncharacterized protein (DUF58 family)
MEAGVQPEAAGVHTEFEGQKGRAVRPSLVRRAGNVLRIAGLLAIALLVGLIHARALAALAVIAGILLVGFLVPWLTARGIRACWHYPLRRGQVGKPLPVRLVLRSRLPWPAVGLLLRGGWADAGSSTDPVTAAVARVPPLGKRDVVTTATPDRRGVYPTSPATLSTAFPFGIRQSRRVESDGPVLVWPEIVPFALPARDAGRLSHGQARRARRGGHQGEFYGTRPYRAGESLRRVHWKQSARHAELIVWEARAEGQAAVVLLLETAAEVHARHAGGDSIEKTLSVGASLANGLVEGGLHVTLGFEPDRLFSVSNRPQLEAALDAMARFDGPRGAGHGALLAQLTPRTVRAGSPWLVTTLAGWERVAGHPLAGRLKALLIDEREPNSGTSNRPPYRPAGEVTLIPLADPGHRRLRDAWEEVLGAPQVVV